MPPLPRPLYVDVTTSWEEAARHPHGTTRTERGLVAALAAMPEAGIRFFRFDRNGGVFVAVSAEEAHAAARTAPLPDRRRDPRPSERSRIGELGISIETWVRTKVRAPLRRWLATRKSASDSDPRQLGFGPCGPIAPFQLRAGQRAFVCRRNAAA